MTFGIATRNSATLIRTLPAIWWSCERPTWRQQNYPCRWFSAIHIGRLELTYQYCDCGQHVAAISQPFSSPSCCWQLTYKSALPHTTERPSLTALINANYLYLLAFSTTTFIQSIHHHLLNKVLVSHSPIKVAILTIPESGSVWKWVRKEVISKRLFRCSLLT